MTGKTKDGKTALEVAHKSVKKMLAQKLKETSQPSLPHKRPSGAGTGASAKKAKTGVALLKAATLELSAAGTQSPAAAVEGVNSGGVLHMSSPMSAAALSELSAGGTSWMVGGSCTENLCSAGLQVPLKPAPPRLSALLPA